MQLRVPANTTILQTPEIPACANPTALLDAALAAPIAAPALEQIVRRKKPSRVVITISDITRPVPNEPIVTALLRVLNANGVTDSQVTILVATGMHRPSTPAEKQIMLGQALLRRVRVVDHVADDIAGLVPVSNDPPVSVNALFMKADLRIVTGLIEPHFMAGYSGGRKGICPALVDLHTVQRFHGYRIMADLSSTEGVLTGNPCNEEALRIASLVGMDFLVNVAITHDRRVAGVWAGDMIAAHAAGCEQVGKWTSAVVGEPFDLVVTSAGGFPLDQNFYQSVKGMVAALPALGKRSTLLLLSACHEIGSAEYTRIMLDYRNDWRKFLADIAARSQVTKDQWQLQMQARVLERVGIEKLRLVNAGLSLPQQAQLCVNPVGGTGNETERAQRFIDEYVAAQPTARLAVIPEGPYTMLRRAY